MLSPLVSVVGVGLQETASDSDGQAGKQEATGEDADQQQQQEQRQKVDGQVPEGEKVPAEEEEEEEEDEEVEEKVEEEEEAVEEEEEEDFTEAWVAALSRAAMSMFLARAMEIAHLSMVGK